MTTKQKKIWPQMITPVLTLHLCLETFCCCFFLPASCGLNPHTVPLWTSSLVFLYAAWQQRPRGAVQGGILTRTFGVKARPKKQPPAGHSILHPFHHTASGANLKPRVAVSLRRSDCYSVISIFCWSSSTEVCERTTPYCKRTNLV